MVITMEQILSIINSTEPDYEEGSKLGSDAVIHLQTLINSGDPKLASKAAYLASFIDDENY
jgi:hypothetical protein